MPDREHTLTRILRERGQHLTDPILWARARAEAHAAETGMPDDEYDPASIRVLAPLGPSKRDPDDPLWRWAGEFLGLPPDDTGAPCGVPGVVPEPLGEPGE